VRDNRPSDYEDRTVTLPQVEPHGVTPLELVLRLHGEFRRRLAPLGVTPLQAGVMLYLHRQGEAKLKEAAAAVTVQPPTVTDVITGLVRKRWVTKQRALHDDRALCLRLSRQGEALARKITECLRDIRSNLTFQEE
jgi:DNA-binding MarR family transcriptional regulator